MKFEAMSPEKTLETLLSEAGPFLSLYLPYGILVTNEEKLRIDRKNTLSEARGKLAGLANPFYAEILETIIAENSNEGTKHPERPYTQCYFVNQTQAIKTVLPAGLCAHFSFQTYAELEPLIYNKWIDAPYVVFRLDLGRPEIFFGSGPELTVPVIDFPMLMQNTFGADLDDYSLDKVLAVIDRNRRTGADLDKSDFGGYFGFTSRQISHRESNIRYWFKVVDALFKANLKEPKTPVFLIGEESLCQKFIGIHGEGYSPALRFLRRLERDDQSKIAGAVMSDILEEKFLSSSDDFKKYRLHEDLTEVAELLLARQVRKLFVQRDAWITETSSQRGQYERSNPRALILQDAVRRDVKIVYTNHPIQNTQGIAALA